MIVRNASLFSQLLQMIPRDGFDQLVVQHRAEARSKGFSCWDQFVAMLFCQVAQAHSLREISMGLSSTQGKLIHLGLHEAPSRSTLSYANAHRPWELYRDLFALVLAQAQAFAPGKKLRFRNPLYSLDATTLDLCLEVFDWAHFRRKKGAVKLHLVLDHEGYLPIFAHITDGKTQEVKIAQELSFPEGAIVVMDKGYNDYALFNTWCDGHVGFVTRMKENAKYEALEMRPSSGKVLKDELIMLTGTRAPERCPHLLRRIVMWDEKQQRELVFLTNLHQFAASTICAIYKERWQIELFFKALKQNLRVKTFVGTSANALKTQIWTALLAMLLLKILRFRSTFGWSLSSLVALLRMNLFTYRNLWEWLNQPFDTLPQPPSEPLLFGTT